MVKALVDIYDATGNEAYLKRAMAAMEKIWQLMFSDDGLLYRIRTSGRTAIAGFLDDYAFLTEACLALVQSGGDMVWYSRASQLLTIVSEQFYDDRSGLFRFGTTKDAYSQKLDTQDNVIPSSNSCLSKCFFIMAHLSQNDQMSEMGKRMLQSTMPMIEYASGYSNWLQHYLWQCESFYEIAITGKDAQELSKELRAEYLPQKIIAASTIESGLPLLKDKFGTVSAIYVCTGKTCFPPMANIQEALTNLK